MNKVKAKDGFVAIGQVKLSPNQQMVAYTIDTADGNEAYESQVQLIAGASSDMPICMAE